MAYYRIFWQLCECYETRFYAKPITRLAGQKILREKSMKVRKNKHLSVSYVRSIALRPMQSFVSSRLRRRRGDGRFRKRTAT